MREDEHSLINELRVSIEKPGNRSMLPWLISIDDSCTDVYCRLCQVQLNKPTSRGEIIQTEGAAPSGSEWDLSPMPDKLY